MTLYIIIGILMGFGLYLLFLKRGQRTNLQPATNQRVNDHHSHNESNHNDKKGPGCCG